MNFKLFLSASLLLISSIHSAHASVGKIALVQYDADLHFDQYSTNMKALKKFALEAVKNHSSMIVFPEGSAYGYADQNHFWCDSNHTDPKCVDVKKVAEKIPGGRTEKYWARLAKAKKVYVFFNLPELGDDGKFYNTTGVVGPSGYITKYRKRRLYYIDTYYASAGTSPAALSTPYGKFGIAICMDGTDSGPLEEYKAMGMNAVILPMDWDDDPQGANAAKGFFTRRSAEADIDIYASDVSKWDGSGKYSSGHERERDGLPFDAIGVDGITYSNLNY